MTTSQRRKPATIQDVVRAAGVTKATASYTFSGKRQVTPATRASVLRAAEALGYEPNFLAQRLSNGPHCGNTIGLFSGHLTYEAARHLLELGRRRIGFYTNGGLPGGSRLTGFRRALAEFGAPLREQWLFSGYHEDGGARTALAFLNLAERPTGLCMVNDYAATAFIGTAQRAGIRVPEDVSVVSHADMPIARHGATPLTTMTHPVEIIVRHVVELLASRLENRHADPPREIVVRGELVRRQSARQAS